MAEREAVDATRRTRLANERTYLAWLRTALTALAVAVGIGKIVPGVTDLSRVPFEILGAGFAVVAIIVIVYGALRFLRVERALDDGEFAPLDIHAAIALTALMAVLGVGSLAIVLWH